MVGAAEGGGVVCELGDGGWVGHSGEMVIGGCLGVWGFWGGGIYGGWEVKEKGG